MPAYRLNNERNECSHQRNECSHWIDGIMRWMNKNKFGLYLLHLKTSREKNSNAMGLLNPRTIFSFDEPIKRCTSNRCLDIQCYSFDEMKEKQIECIISMYSNGSNENRVKWLNVTCLWYVLKIDWNLIV